MRDTSRTARSPGRRTPRKRAGAGLFQRVARVGARLQARLGVDDAGALLESALAAIARGLAERGVRQFVVAGGETSGAVVQALGVTPLRIGPQIDPGVPWCAAHARAAGATMRLALKSGNFGTPDFFTRAFAVLPGVRQEARRSHG